MEHGRRITRTQQQQQRQQQQQKKRLDGGRRMMEESVERERERERERDKTSSISIPFHPPIPSCRVTQMFSKKKRKTNTFLSPLSHIFGPKTGENNNPSFVGRHLVITTSKERKIVPEWAFQTKETRPTVTIKVQCQCYLVLPVFFS